MMLGVFLALGIQKDLGDTSKERTVLERYEERSINQKDFWVIG